MAGEKALAQFVRCDVLSLHFRYEIPVRDAARELRGALPRSLQARRHQCVAARLRSPLPHSSVQNGDRCLELRLRKT
jgi:hypothetical protein